MAEDRIILDRAELLKLCDVMDRAPALEHANFSFRNGWLACTTALREIAAEMPNIHNDPPRCAACGSITVDSEPISKAYINHYCINPECGNAWEDHRPP